MSVSISVPQWTPPDLSSLDFSSNCTLVQGFLKSWFDLTPYEDIDKMPGHGFNVTFWVPETVDARATETYFRQALPSGLQNVASYGAILEWEQFLRKNYSEAITNFLDLAVGLNETEIDVLPLDVPYYDHVIHAPSRACRKEVCLMGFDWDKLGDINGPGVFIYYALLLLIGYAYSLIAVIDACRHRSRPMGPYPQPCRKPPRGCCSFFGDLFATVRITFSGFSDSAAVFSLALPCAIAYNYWEGDVSVSSRKDLMLELWVLVYALCVCVWFYRLGACIRRAQRQKHEALHGAPAPKSRKRTLSTAVVLSLSAPAFVLLVTFLASYYSSGPPPFKFEMFWDEFCDYGALSTRKVFAAIGGLAVYCASRVLISYGFLKYRVYRASREKKKSCGHDGYRPPRGQKLQLYKEVHSTDKRYHRGMKILGVLDVLLLMIGSSVILWYYFEYRQQLSRSIGTNGFSDGWGLGQILAVSSLLSVVVGFVHTFVGLLNARQENTI